MFKKGSKISEIPDKTFKELCDSLDINSTWRTLVEVLSNTPYLLRDVEREECSQELYKSLHGSPSKRLLHKLDLMGMTVEKLCIYLDQAKLARPLLYVQSHVPLEIQEQPKDKVEIDEGTTLKIQCKASGFPYPEYVWFVGDKEMSCCSDGVLKIKNIRTFHEGTYSCRIQHSSNNEWFYLFSSSCSVVVKPAKHTKPSVNNHPPQILVQPTSQTNSLGGVVVLQVKAQHKSLPLSYQWFHNNEIIIGACKSEYKIDHLKKCHSGRYQVRVYSEEDCHVQVVSNVATLTILNKPNQFYAKDKVALILGNSNYRSYGSNLPGVEEDMVHTCHVLENMDFKVLSFLDLTLQEMQCSLETFCSLMGDGVYVLLYCLGHGFFHNHHHYLIPWDASQGVKLSESLCIETCIQRIQQQKPTVLMAILDVCRKNVELSSISPAPNEAIDKSYPNQVIIYATSVGEESYEMKLKHKFRGLFNEYLMDVIKNKNLTLGDLYNELKKEFRACPIDLNSQKYSQHSEMKINIEDPERKLWDPIAFESLSTGDVDSVWDSLHYLGENTEVKFQNKTIAKLSFQKYFSNVLALETSVEKKGAILEIRKNDIDQVLLPVKKTEKLKKKVFFLYNLQRLKKPISLIFDVKMGSEGGKSEVIDIGYPLISQYLNEH